MHQRQCVRKETESYSMLRVLYQVVLRVLQENLSASWISSDSKRRGGPGILWNILVLCQTVMDVTSVESVQVIFPGLIADQSCGAIDKFFEVCHSEQARLVSFRNRNDRDV